MTFTIDAATLEVATVLTSAVMAGALFWTFRLRRLNSALMWWGTTFAFAAIHAVSLFRDRSAAFPYGAFVDEISLVATGFACWFGFRAFNDKRSPVWPLFVVCGLFFAGLFVLQLPEATTITAAIAMLLVLTVICAVTAVRGGEGDRSWRGLACALLLAHAAFLVVRMFNDPGGPLPAEISSQDLLQVVFVVEPMILPVLLGYTLLGLVYDKEQQKSLLAQHTDLLTGALNRRGFEAFVSRADRGQSLGVIVFDLDRFKVINDTFGHSAGDDVLRLAAERVKLHVRPIDATVRMGGEEFVVVMPGADNAAVAAAAERMRAALEHEPLPLPGHSLDVTASFGVASISAGWDRARLEDALVAADSALYTAKHEGRNVVRTAQ